MIQQLYHTTYNDHIFQIFEFLVVALQEESRFILKNITRHFSNFWYYSLSLWNENGECCLVFDDANKILLANLEIDEM